MGTPIGAIDEVPKHRKKKGRKKRAVRWDCIGEPQDSWFGRWRTKTSVCRFHTQQAAKSHIDTVSERPYMGCVRYHPDNWKHTIIPPGEDPKTYPQPL